jgi:hypothetical protein
MNEKKKHKIMLGIEVVLLCMIVAILGTNAASGNPPSNGVSYNKNSQTTVEGALNDLYTKANYGSATASQILKGKTALVGGNKVTGTMEDRGLAQYGNWGCGSAGCGSGNDAYYAINGLPEGYYHSDGNTWAPEARINANTLRASLGITADKIVKGKTIAGVSGTGETGYSSCSSCCPTCNQIDDTRLLEELELERGMTGGITAEIGDYYLIFHQAGLDRSDTATFTGCDRVVDKKNAGYTVTLNDNRSVTFRSRVIICKAKATTITVSSNASNWYWVKLT